MSICDVYGCVRANLLKFLTWDHHSFCPLDRPAVQPKLDSRSFRAVEHAQFPLSSRPQRSTRQVRVGLQEDHTPRLRTQQSPQQRAVSEVYDSPTPCVRGV